MIDKSHITGIILAGGKSSRMGQDKGLLLLDQKPFVQYSIDALRPLVSEILIVTDNPLYDAFNCKRVSDITKNAGPIAGIYSGLQASSTGLNLILSCDIPLISPKILRKLIDSYDNSAEIIQIESNGKTMPLIALYKTQVKTTFNQLLQANERRLRMAVKACKTKNVVLEKENALFTTNVNTPNDFKTVTNEYNR